MSNFISHARMQRVDNHFQATNATLCGDVTLGQDCSIWFNAVVRGDVAAIRIGPRTNIQEHCVLHCDSGEPMSIGADITIGHGAVVHCESIGDGSLIGMKAVILGKARIGKNCIVAAGCVVSPGTVVPDGMVIMGIPGKVVRPVKEAETAHTVWNTNHYVELAREHVREPEKFYK